MTPEQMQRYALLSNAFGRLSALGSGGQQPSAVNALLGIQQNQQQAEAQRQQMEFEKQKAAALEQKMRLEAQQYQDQQARGQNAMQMIQQLAGGGGSTPGAASGSVTPSLGGIREESLASSPLGGVRPQTPSLDPKIAALAMTMVQSGDEKSVEKGMQLIAPFIAVDANAQQVAQTARERLDFDRQVNSQADRRMREKTLEEKTARVSEALEKKPAEIQAQFALNLQKEEVTKPVISAVNLMGTINRMEETLGKDVFTGPFAEQRMALSRGIQSILGEQGSDKLAASTQLVQGLAEFALDARLAISGQGPITDAEAEAARKAKMASSINELTPKELKLLLDLGKRRSELVIEDYKIKRDAISNTPGFTGLSPLFIPDSRLDQFKSSAGSKISRTARWEVIR